MEVNEFIQLVLKEVSNGVEKASKETGVDYYLENEKAKGVHFDIAVTSSSSSQKNVTGKAGIGLEVVGIVAKISGETGSEESKEFVNRIQFNVSYPSKN